MSIGRLILHYWLSILSQFRVEIMCYNNLVIISPTHQLGTSAGGVKKLKINKRPSKLGSRLNQYTSTVNTKNLVHIQLGTDQIYTSNVRVGTVNTRSIKKSPTY